MPFSTIESGDSYAFDMLWDEHPKSDDEEGQSRFRNGEGVRYLPLIDRNSGFMQSFRNEANVFLLRPHRHGREGLPRLACEHTSKALWRSATRSLSDRSREMAEDSQSAVLQWVGGVERGRGSNPDFQIWDGCVLATHSLIFKTGGWHLFGVIAAGLSSGIEEATGFAAADDYQRASGSKPPTGEKTAFVKTLRSAADFHSRSPVLQPGCHV